MLGYTHSCSGCTHHACIYIYIQVWSGFWTYVPISFTIFFSMGKLTLFFFKNSMSFSEILGFFSKITRDFSKNRCQIWKNRCTFWNILGHIEGWYGVVMLGFDRFWSKSECFIIFIKQYNRHNQYNYTFKNKKIKNKNIIFI